jgi:menaquinone-specific isochorismate synthase
VSATARPAGRAPGGLRARTVAWEGGATDPIALSGADGVLYAGSGLTLAGVGVAARIRLPGGLADFAGVAGARAQLAAIPCDDGVHRPGSGVVALSALPFDRDAAGHLVVPRLLYGQDGEGRRWITQVDREPADAEVLARLEPGRPPAGVPARGSDPGASAPELVDRPPPESYAKAVAEAVRAMAVTELRKVVLTRTLEAQLPAAPSSTDVLRRLRAQEPSCTVFSFPVPGGRFLGASPELLVARRGRAVTCHPLAGTVGLSGRAPEDGRALERLAASAKDQDEHRYVVEEIARVLRPLCDILDIPASPQLVSLHSVAHLGTLITGTLAHDGDRVPGVLELVAALHPTPAVGGVPLDEALSLIGDLEATPRDHWAGPVGWTDAAGDGDWVIGIRSATLSGGTALLRAGAGIVAGSDPEAELAETTLKLRTVLEAIWPGAGGVVGA